MESLVIVLALFDITAYVSHIMNELIFKQTK